ncbi:MAG: hypothetical protein WCC90_11900 [Methylocella sp.]
MLARRCFVDESRNATGIINQDKYPPSSATVLGMFNIADSDEDARV